MLSKNSAPRHTHNKTRLVDHGKTLQSKAKRLIHNGKKDLQIIVKKTEVRRTSITLQLWQKNNLRHIQTDRQTNINLTYGHKHMCTYTPYINTYITTQTLYSNASPYLHLGNVAAEHCIKPSSTLCLFFANTWRPFTLIMVLSPSVGISSEHWFSLQLVLYKSPITITIYQQFTVSKPPCTASTVDPSNLRSTPTPISHHFNRCKQSKSFEPQCTGAMV